jgi:hypothetical protein
MNRRGRPPLDPNDRSVDVHLRIPARQYDALYERARRSRVDVNDQIRHELHKESVRATHRDDE